MTTRAEMTAGTASSGYLVAAAPHVFRGDIPDPGARQRCTHPGCGLERNRHPRIPSPRPVPSTEGREP